MDERLEILAVKSGGYFTRAEALDCGMQDRDLAGGVRSGVLRKLRQGAYAPAVLYDALDDADRHLVLARATLVRQRGDVALTGVSAAAAHGLTLWGHDLGLVEMVRLDRGSARCEVNARHHVAVDDLTPFLEMRNGVLVTNVTRTLWDLTAHASLEAGVVTADSALRMTPTLRPELDQMAERMGRRRGSRRARVAFRLADGRAATAGESISRVQMYRHQVPMPDLQHVILDTSGQFIAEVDCYWEADHHAGEFDGKVKYGRLRRPGESEGDAVFREKRREDRVRGERLGMTRWVWVDLFPPAAARWIHRLNSDREQSRRLYTHNRTIIA